MAAIVKINQSEPIRAAKNIFAQQIAMNRALAELPCRKPRSRKAAGLIQETLVGGVKSRFSQNRPQRGAGPISAAASQRIAVSNWGAEAA